MDCSFLASFQRCERHLGWTRSLHRSSGGVRRLSPQGQRARPAAGGASPPLQLSPLGPGLRRKRTNFEQICFHLCLLVCGHWDV